MRWLTLALALASSAALAESVSQVKAPSPGRFSVDLTGSLSPSTLLAFDAIAARRKDSGVGEMGLAVVHTTKGMVPRQFATQVFNAWGIGHPATNDGVLLFFALDDHKAEIVLGSGFAPIATNDTDVIMRDDVISNMKRGSPDRAATIAAQSISDFIERQLAAPTTATPTAVDLDQNDTDEEKLARAMSTGEAPIPEKSPREWTIDVGHLLPRGEQALFDRPGDAVYASGKGLLFVVLARSMRVDLSGLADRLQQQLDKPNIWVVAASIDGARLFVTPPVSLRSDVEVRRACTAIEQRGAMTMGGSEQQMLETVLEAAKATSKVAIEGAPAREIGEVVSDVYERHTVGALGGVGGLALGGLVGVRSMLRRRARKCKGCGTDRVRLSEDRDDTYLSAPQVLEESLGSVDYDVWWCGRCHDALVLRYGAIFTVYSSCSACSFKTASSVSRTLITATYDHGGSVEVTTTCRNCHNTSVTTRYTSRLTRDTSSSSSSSSSSSYSGGSSSGGGSSGSW